MMNEPVKETFREAVDSASKAAVVGLLTIYVLGFVIVSLHNAKYGFSDLNPLKPRIMAAGTLFTFFCIYPIALARGFFSHNLQLSPEQRFSRGLLATLNFLSSCIFSALVLATLYEAKPVEVGKPARGWVAAVEIVILIALLAIWGWLMGLGRAYFQKHPMKIAIAALGLVIFLLAYLYSYSDRAIPFAVALWFFAVGTGWTLIRESFKAPKERRFTSSDLLAPMLGLLVLFGTEIYPRVRPSWGGGSPTPVFVYLSRDSRILPNQQFAADMLDDSDGGVYVVKHGEKQAIFIPRAAIAAMYFSDKPLGPEFLKEALPTQPTQPPNQLTQPQAIPQREPKPMPMQIPKKP
jgi:hypothetical protein